MAPLVRTGGSRHTGLAAPPHRNIQIPIKNTKEISFGVFYHNETSQKSLEKFLQIIGTKS
jgi:hypothetical protein